METLFRNTFGSFYLKETKDGPIVISRTATEIEAIQMKARLLKIPIVGKRISPDIVYFGLKKQVESK